VNKRVLNAIAELAVHRQQVAVNWTSSDGKRRWKIGAHGAAGLTDAEAIEYLSRASRRRRFRIPVLESI